MTADFDKSNSLFPNDNDLGEPIAALLDLEQDTSPSFFARVRRKIHRRTTGSQLASFSWYLPRMILLEFWNVLIHILNPGAPQKGGRS